MKRIRFRFSLVEVLSVITLLRNRLPYLTGYAMMVSTESGRQDLPQ